jgi:arylsulfatase A-like enzyme
MNKQLKVKSYFITCSLFLFLISVQLFAQNNQKPNVIVIYTDDQGAVDMGSYGSKDIYTPNMDKIANEGTRFTQAYVAAPVCAPSRAALLTGKYPQGAGVPGNTSHEPGSHGLPSDQYTLAELFKDNGYRTGHIGKWHLGMSKETGPNAQGFDYSFGHLRGCIDNYSHFFFWAGPNIHDLYENGKEVFHNGAYFPDLISDRAINFVDQYQKDPFFLYYAINMPHYPYQPTDKWRKHYQDVENPRGEYAAFISTIDERIGLLLDKLDELGLRENTIIIYQSDNGYSTEIRAFNGGGSSGPYRGAKFSLFEGGIRLPTMISWKDKLPGNIVNDQFFVNYDWMPTLANLCNLKNIPKNIDGIDMSPMIENPGTASPRTTAFWKSGNQWVVRKGKWKLIGFPKDTSHKGDLDLEEDALFLSDLENDVSEMTNLANKYPEVVKELIGDFINWEHGSAKYVPKKSDHLDHLGKKGSIKAIKKLPAKYNKSEILLDGKRGYLDFSTGQWVGQNGKDLEFIIDLKSTQAISEIGVGYLHLPSDWVFSPKIFTVSFSEDGINFVRSKQSQVSKRIDEKESFSDQLTMGQTEKSRFVKINIQSIGLIPEGHEGAGNPGWLFLDEIIIK